MTTIIITILLTALSGYLGYRIGYRNGHTVGDHEGFGRGLWKGYNADERRRLRRAQKAEGNAKAPMSSEEEFSWLN
jgi:hypothetical protein